MESSFECPASVHIGHKYIIITSPVALWIPDLKGQRLLIMTLNFPPRLPAVMTEKEEPLMDPCPSFYREEAQEGLRDSFKVSVKLLRSSVTLNSNPRLPLISVP